MAAHPAGKGRALEDLPELHQLPELADVLAAFAPNVGIEEVLFDGLTRVKEINEFEFDALETFAALMDVLVTKQADYGPDAINRAPGGALNGVLVRIHDKYERLRHLTQVGIAPSHESIRDSFVDLANYAVIALMVIDGTWPRS